MALPAQVQPQDGNYTATPSDQHPGGPFVVQNGGTQILWHDGNTYIWNESLDRYEYYDESIGWRIIYFFEDQTYVAVSPPIASVGTW